MSVRPIVITVATEPSHPCFERHNEPVCIGVSLPRGVVQRPDGWSLTDQQGRAVPVQATVADRWSDGSVRWLLVEFQAATLSDAPVSYRLEPGVADAPPALVDIEESGDMLRVSTGPAQFEIPTSGGMLLRAHAEGALVLGSSTLTAEDAGGERYSFEISSASVDRRGSLAASIRLDGHLAAAGVNWLDATVWLKFFAGLGSVKAEISVTNPRPARHAGGLWDLGDPGSVLVRSLAVNLVAGCNSPDVRGSLGVTDKMEPAGDRFAVYQDSSGGENWQHPNHRNRRGEVPLTFRGFQANRAGSVIEGFRATPIASIGDGRSALSVALPNFWQVFPKAIAADSRGCVVEIFPRRSADVQELQGGERTTFRFAICCGRDTVTAEPLAWVRTPLRVFADPSSYGQAGAWAPLASGSPAARDGYDALLRTAIDGDNTFVQRREKIDEYGWRNFGEMYADHEAVRTPDGLVSHYNNQYDAVAGFLTRFMQTGDQRWWVLADDLARHVTDIDLYNTCDDRAAYNGGYFWHTQHYSPAGTATHRTYSRMNETSGGGPSAEHNYTTGLMLHYFMTGSERSRESVIQLANWVLDMDDGRKSRFRWIDSHDTGLASNTRSRDFHGPGRGAANSINAVLDAHRLTGDPRYLAKAEQLVARCVHPDDDPAAIDPLDVENRWSYTVFLQCLGRYLEYRAERGLVDAGFDYARAVLLKYAAWIATHEKPYLDTPEKLEFPTETWAAHDLRKAAVLEFALRQTFDAGERARFQQRADEFVSGAIATLQARPTGTLVRPLVLLLAYGVQRPMLTLDVRQSQPLPFKRMRREPFVPLHQRIVKRLVVGAGLCAAALVVIALLNF